MSAYNFISFPVIFHYTQQQYIINQIMSQKDFITWSEEKSKLQEKENVPYFHTREIWFISTGLNVWVEQDGKNTNFSRPVLILKKFNKHSFWGIPLSTQVKIGKTYFNFSFHDGIKSFANMSQLKLFSSKRLLRKIGVIHDAEFSILKEKIKSLIDDQ